MAVLSGRDIAYELVITSEHPDTRDLGTTAIDDGAGVAVTMEVLQRIKEAGLKPGAPASDSLGQVELRRGRRALSYAYADKLKYTLQNHFIGKKNDVGAGRIWKTTLNISEQAKRVADNIAELLEPLGIAPGSNNARSSSPDLSPMNAEDFPAFQFVEDRREYFDFDHTLEDTQY